MTIKIQLLGSPEIFRDHVPIKLPGYKPLGLLAYLLLHPNPQQRQHLVDLLFADAKDPRAALRWVLNQLKKALGADCFDTNRQTIGFNFSVDYELDIDSFLTGDTNAYRGDFLEGFSVRNSQSYMNWLYFQRERYRIDLQDLLVEKISDFEASKNYQEIVNIGHQLLQLDNLREEWYQVLMGAYIQLGRRDEVIRLYQTCQDILASELSINPSIEMKRLYDNYIEGNVSAIEKQNESKQTSSSENDFPISFPSITIASPPFFARQNQVLQLESYYQNTLSRQGNIVFISGDIGRGKTSFVSRFSSPLVKQSQANIAFGNCNAFEGMGDAFLPFRDIFDSLTGNISWAVNQGILTAEEAKTNWSSLLIQITRLILRKGPLLANSLLDIDKLVARLEWLGTSESKSLASQLKYIQVQDVVFDQSNQSQLFQQTVEIFQNLSEEAPLILILDDLHWADHSSLALLFHLARRIQNNRILILCTYRPNNTSLNQNDEDGNSISHLLVEMTRLYGNTRIDLDGIDEEENRKFVRSLLKFHLDKVSSSFTQKFYEYTRGHPLFSVELLRSIIDRDDDVDYQNHKVSNVETSIWRELPDKVEAIIEMRFQQQPEAIQEILQVAAVVGPTFSAQVVSQVVGLSLKQTVSLLSQALKSGQQITNYVGQQQIGDQIIDNFQFQNRFFQLHLINKQNAVELRLLHHEIADALESVYRDQSDLVMLRLANHYEMGGDLNKAAVYYGKAAEVASNRFAHEDVIAFVSKSLALTKRLSNQNQYDFVSIREQSYGILGHGEKQLTDLRLLQNLAEELSDIEKQTEIALRLARYNLANNSSVQALEIAYQAIALAQSRKDTYFEAIGHLYIGRALIQQNKQQSALANLNKALEISKKEQMELVEATSLRSFGEFSHQEGEYTVAYSYYQQALKKYPLGTFSTGKAHALQNLGELSQEKGDYYQAKAYFLEALNIFQEVGHRHGEGSCLVDLGINATLCGDYFLARQFLVRGLTSVRNVGDSDGEIKALSYLGFVAMHIRDGETAVFHCRHAIGIAQENENQELLAFSLYMLGRVFLHLFKGVEAKSIFKQALQIDTKQNKYDLYWIIQAGLAEAELELENFEEAKEISTEIWVNWNQSKSNKENFKVWLLAVCYFVFNRIKDERAQHVLNEAYQKLQMLAAHFEDQNLKRLFIESVPEHAQIVKAFEASGGK